MKKHITLIAVLALAILSAGCTADIAGDGLSGHNGKDGLQQVILTATLDDEGGQAGTKTALIDKKFHWSPNDSISLFYGPGEDGGSLFISTNTDYVKKTTFSGYIQVVTGTSEGSDATKFWGIFPYDPTSSCVDGGAAVMTTVKSSQETGYNSWGKSQNISIGRSLGLTMGFSNLCGGFIFCVTQPGIERVVLRRNDRTPVAGQVKVTMDSEEKPLITQMLGTETEISVTAPEGFTPINGSDTTWFYVVVPPTENEEQYTFTLYNGSGQYAEYEVPYTYKVKRNTFKRMRPPIDEGLEFQSDEPVSFTNANFKFYCVGEFDNNGDGEVSQSEADLVTKIEVITDDITSLGGIENFPNLIELKATGSSVSTKGTKSAGAGQLQSIDVSANTKLEILDCRGNQLTTLDVSNNPALTVLECTDNPLETIQMAAGQEGIMTTFEAPDEIDIEYNGALPAAFPDETFRAYVFDNFDSNNDGILSQSECNAVTEINVCTDNIASLVGIAAFENLTYLACRGSMDSYGDALGQLTSLDLSNNPALQYLDCSYNPCSSVDVSNTALTELHVCSMIHGDHAGFSTSLNLSGCTALEFLECFYIGNELDLSECTRLRHVDIENSSITSLDLSNNTSLTDILLLMCGRLTNLNVSNCSSLTELTIEWCSNLSGLDVSGCTALTDLNCSGSQLTELDVSTNLQLSSLDCTDNPLETLYLLGGQAISQLYKPDETVVLYVGDSEFPDGNLRNYVYTVFDTDHDGTLSKAERNAVTEINVAYNDITSLVGVELFPNLTTLNCSNNNQLSSIDVSNIVSLKHLNCESCYAETIFLSGCSALESLQCGYNAISTLDLSGCPNLKTLACDHNGLSSLDISDNTALEELYVMSCASLESLDLSNNIALKTINCNGAGLTSLNVSNNLALTSLDCTNNPMTTLYLKQGQEQTLTDLQKPESTVIEYVGGSGNSNTEPINPGTGHNW